MKVAILFRGSSKSIPHIVAVANFLAKSGLDISLIGLATENERPDALRPNVNFVRLSSVDENSYPRRGLEAIELRKLLREGAYDILHIASHGPLATCILSGIFSIDAKLVFHAFDHLEPSKYPLRAWIWGWFLRKCDLVLDVEPNRAHFLKCAYRLNSLPLVVPNRLGRDWPVPARNDKLRKELERGCSAPDPVIVIYQGWIVEERRTHILVEAMAHLPARYILHVIGPMDSVEFEQRLKQIAVRYRLEERVIFHPNMTHEKLLHYTACSDIGVLFYGDEHFANYYCSPNKLSEYAASGVPMIGPNYSGIVELFRNHQLGETVNPNDPVAVAKTIQSVAESQPGLLEKSVTVRRSFLEALAFDNYGPDLVEAYQQLVDK